jgi:hypothetical protein
MATDEQTCILCLRDTAVLTDHHLVPKSRGGRELISICPECHKQLHAIHDNKELEALDTVEAILADEQFVRFLRWVRKRPVGAVSRAQRTRETRKRRRRQ